MNQFHDHRKPYFFIVTPMGFPWFPMVFPVLLMRIPGDWAGGTRSLPGDTAGAPRHWRQMCLESGAIHSFALVRQRMASKRGENSSTLR